MQIVNFQHNGKNKNISFGINHNGKTNNISVTKTESGTTMTDIQDFTNDWSESEHMQLESFVDGCSNMLHKFYHY